MRIGAAERMMRQHTRGSARRRFGYRRLYILFKRERIIMNHNKHRHPYAGSGFRCVAGADASERSGSSSDGLAAGVQINAEPGPPIGRVTMQV